MGAVTTQRNPIGFPESSQSESGGLRGLAQVPHFSQSTYAFQLCPLLAQAVRGKTKKEMWSGQGCQPLLASQSKKIKRRHWPSLFGNRRKSTNFSSLHVWDSMRLCSSSNPVSRTCLRPLTRLPPPSRPGSQQPLGGTGDLQASPGRQRT